MIESQVLLPERVEHLTGVTGQSPYVMDSSILQLQALQASITSELPPDASHEADGGEVVQWDSSELRPEVSSQARNVHAIDYALMAVMFAIITFLWMQ